MKLFFHFFCFSISFASICEISGGFSKQNLATSQSARFPQTTGRLHLLTKIQMFGNTKEGEKQGCSDQLVHGEVIDDLTDDDASSFGGSQMNDRVPDKEMMNESGGLFSGIFLLNIVAILWGTQHAIIKSLVNDTTPAAYSLLRFGLAAFLSSPYLPELPLKNHRNAACEAWRWGCELAIYQFLGSVMF